MPLTTNGDCQSLLPYSSPFASTLMKLFCPCTCYWEWGPVWVIWPTSSWMQLFASPHVGAVHLNLDVLLTSCLDHCSLQGCHEASWTPYGWSRAMGNNQDSSSAQYWKELKMQKAVCAWVAHGGTESRRGSTQVLWPAVKSSRAASGNLKGWDQPQKLLPASSVEVKVYGKSNFQLQ